MRLAVPNHNREIERRVRITFEELLFYACRNTRSSSLQRPRLGTFPGGAFSIISRQQSAS